jgi:hypothetical protein
MQMLWPKWSRFVIGWLMLASAACGAEPIPQRDFKSLHALIKPQAGEWRWAAIPWETSLWEARRKAAELGKPILLWEMDGNPLGCT